MRQRVDKAQARRLLNLATWAAVFTAAVLILAKLAAWYLSGSVSMLASLIDSLMDVLASTINLVAVRFAMAPADEEHRFGHGKAESLAGLAQSTFIFGSGLFLIFHAIDRMLHPQPLTDTLLSVAVMSFSIVATGALLALQHHVVKRTGSVAIKADSLHYLTDLLTNAGIIVALVLAYLGWTFADPLIGLLVALYILRGAWQIAREAVDVLLDRELDETSQRRIEDLALQHPDVLAVHELRTRQAGADTFIQMHLEMDGNMPLRQAHFISDQVMYAILKEFPNAEVLIHEDAFNPRGADNKGKNRRLTGDLDEGGEST